MELIPNAENAKNAKKFFCEIYDFKCSKKSNYDKHITTLKHQNLINPNGILTKTSKIFKCENCNKIYKHSSTLCAHKKNCCGKSLANDITSNCVITPELIIELIKINTIELIKSNTADMKQLISEQNNIIQGLVSNGINNNNSHNINQTNSHNKSFNLQFFLNETCKNAMNIMDFANSIQVKLTDLENIGELGYVDGISKIIIDNLKLLDVTQIPVHCSDFKREMMYVKDNDKWDKENDDKPNIKKLINCVTDKNISLISEWKNTYPECKNIN